MASIKTFELELGGARVKGSGRGFTVSTGRVERAWLVTPFGLATHRLGRVGGRRWVRGAQLESDWLLRGLTATGEPAELLALEASARKDVDYTADHIELAATLRFAQTGFDLRYSVWVYPDAPGVRTQLSLRPIQPVLREDLPSFLGDCRCERLALPAGKAGLHAAGYYSDTQHRNYDHTPILRTQDWPKRRAARTVIDWANLMSLEQAGEGLILVKESHKTVNQEGVDTGAFVVTEGGVEVTGLGLTPNHYGGGFWADNSGQWRECWATWTILFGSGEGCPVEAARQLAVKAMDRARFPFRPERDRLIMANTWGSGGAGEGSRSAANQANLLRELHSAADLGIEIVQIDDGWQAEPNEPHPVSGDKDWRPSATRWPDGWAMLREEARRLGVDLGLWFPWYVDGEKIAWNVEQGGFRRLKLDFMHLPCRHEIEKVTAKVRALVDRLGPRLGINWDATENAPRMGYYFGRDHGNVYLENRENGPAPLRWLNHIRYTPRLVLRDAWHLAHYMNLNQLQLSIQNKDRVVPDLSNCRLYGHDYCFAITMMGVPLFFQETHYYGPDARAELRPIITLYKQHRNAMLDGYVMPVGDEPCDASWCGFQSLSPDGQGGYLTIFRELNHPDPAARLALHGVAGRTVELTDLRSGVTCVQAADTQGRVEFLLPTAPSFGFYRYRLG